MHRSLLARRGLPLALMTSLLLASLSTPAAAYRLLGTKWPTTSVKYVLSASLTSAEKSYVNSVASTWNDGPSAWTLSSTTADGVYNTYSKTSFSYQGWDGVPGVTFISSSSGVTSKCRTYINTDYSWNNDGVMSKANGRCDYKTVMLHEFGHWISLNEDSCHSSAVMWPNWVTKQALAAPDKDGLEYVY